MTDELLEHAKDRIAEGADSEKLGEMDAKYIESLREHARKIAEK